MSRTLNQFRLIALALALTASGCQSTGNTPQNPQVVEMAKAGKAYYEDKCKTVAGEKIYRTVTDLEAVLLTKVRPERTQTQLEDVMWPGAAFALEATDGEYIQSFLGYEHGHNYSRNDWPTGKVIPAEKRGYIQPDKRPGGLPGYRYVDVMDAINGQRYRVTQRSDEPWQYDKTYLKGYIRYFLDKTPTIAPAPRYGVTFEDHVIPEERAIGVASSTVKVIDLSTNEVLGEVIRYAWRPRGLRLTEWLTANKCPGYPYGASAATRKFVDQVLIPKGE